MKKLVKTAKQQFEFELNALKVVKTWKMCESEIYHHCENSAGHFILLREQDGEYSILLYNRKYIEVVLSEEFLFSVTERFINASAEITQLYNWYSSADHENEPFNLLDIYMSDCEAVHHVYEDEYEEVPDVRIITAKEQWEDASKNAKVAATIGNGSIYKVEVTEQFISFYVFKGDCYSLSVFPPFSELRKDNKFIIKYLELVRMGHDSDMDLALSWLAGGEYKMSELSLLDIYESAQEISSMDFEDKEVPQEQTIEKKDFSSEMKDLRERMVTHIQDLYKTGFSLNAKEFMENTATIAWIGAGCYDTANLRTCYLRDDEDAVCRFCFETLVADEGDSEDYPLSNFSIETLSKIIASMHY